MTIAATAVQTTQRDDPNSMIALALTNKADPSVLAKLMDLQERWEANEARKAYMQAMSEFKKKAPSVLSKDKKVDFTSQKGRTHYNYAGLGGIVGEITAILSDCGLNASWETKQEKDQVSVTCHITHSLGHRESTALSGPLDDSGNKNRIQQIGSTVTYLQRYTLMAALGLATKEQDYDGKGADTRQPVNMPTPKAPPAPTENTYEPLPQAADGLTVEGIIEEVSFKEDKNATPPWKKYGIKIAGVWYGTFSETLGSIATEGAEVVGNYKKKGKYNTLETLALRPELA